MDVGARHPEGRDMFGHPSEVGAEAVGALSSGRPGGPGDTVGGGVGFSQERGQKEHGGSGEDTFDGGYSGILFLPCVTCQTFNTRHEHNTMLTRRT